MTDIQPRMDEHGVGWCDTKCKAYPKLNPQIGQSRDVPECEFWIYPDIPAICEPWVRQMVEQAAANKKDAREALKFIDIALKMLESDDET